MQTWIKNPVFDCRFEFSDFTDLKQRHRQISLYHFELQSCKSISIKHPVDMRSGLAAG